MRTAVLTFVTIVLLVGLALPAVPGAAASDSPSDPDPNGSNETRERLEMPTLDGPDTYAGEHTWLRLWSGDADRAPATQFAEGRFGFEATVAATTDVPFDRPPTAPARWNARNVEGYEDRGVGTSRYPRGTTVTDGQFVRDAYVAIYAIDPSTVLHQDGDRTLYVGWTGRVHAISDYRVPQTLDRSGEVRRSIEEVTQSETEMELVHDGRRLASGQGSRATLPFAGLSGSGTLRVTAEIRVRIDVETRRCTDWDDTEDVCDGEWEESVTARTETVTVDATRAVAVNELGASNSRRVDLQPRRATSWRDRPEDGARLSATGTAGGVAIEPTGRWSSVRVGRDAAVDSPLQFYSRSPDRWERWVEVSPEGSRRSDPGIRPLQVHAYPGQKGVQASGSVAVREMTGDGHDGPTLGPRIDLDVPSRYQRPDALAFVASVNSEDAIDTVTLRGIVPGRTRAVELPSPTPERPVALDVGVERINATHDRVTVTVAEEFSATPITSGHVVIEGQRLAVENGSATTVLASPPRRIEAQYKPASWLDTDRIYEPKREAATRSTASLAVADVIQFVLWMGLALLPLALAILGVEYGTDGRLLGILDADR